MQPGGSLFITTINKTNLSYTLGIVVAEQLLRIVPSGTHDWEKFVSPVELERLLESSKYLFIWRLLSPPTVWLSPREFHDFTGLISWSVHSSECRRIKAMSH